LPLPGDVGIVTGGPPCQGMSGLNRHARTADVLTDSRCVPVTDTPGSLVPSKLNAVNGRVQLLRVHTVQTRGNCLSSTQHELCCNDSSLQSLPLIADKFGCLCRRRNRQVDAFYDIIDWLQPGYVLMENVLDILSKENGMYAKYATARLLQQRYQTRLGMIPAGEHGVAQGRWR
jgi:site-specific DNA-cytosine methylase